MAKKFVDPAQAYEEGKFLEEKIPSIKDLDEKDVASPKDAEKKEKSSRRGDDKPVIKKAMGGMVNYADGGMVRGCKSIQMKGKGFKGTF
jgi:hypothetical protein